MPGTFKTNFKLVHIFLIFQNIILEEIIKNKMKLDPEQFYQGFEVENAYLSSWQSVLVSIVLYLSTLYGIQQYMKTRKAFDLNNLVIVHNGVLSAASGILFYFLVFELGSQMYQRGIFDVFCDSHDLNVPSDLTVYYYINYLFKFVELLDTILLALRKKPMQFLHTYHHSATLVLCWVHLIAGTCVQWIPIVINLLIHVFMYYYYCMHAAGQNVWWKKYLTKFQILQFIVGIIGGLGGLFVRTLHDYVSPVYFAKCHGDYAPSMFGFAILTSYLLLFIQLYRSEGYKKRVLDQDKGKHSDQRFDQGKHSV